jgi:hypothetical protein
VGRTAAPAVICRDVVERHDPVATALDGQRAARQLLPTCRAVDFGWRTVGQWRIAARAAKLTAVLGSQLGVDGGDAVGVEVALDGRSAQMAGGMAARAPHELDGIGCILRSGDASHPPGQAEAGRARRLQVGVSDSQGGRRYRSDRWMPFSTERHRPQSLSTL